MHDPGARVRTVPVAWEFAAVMLVAWLALVSIPLGLGRIGISWDALNHHIYLGWTAEHPRFDRDVLAASYQAFQFPYMYWPVYRLSASGLPGATAGAVLASLHALAVPPVWGLARRCIPGHAWTDATMRALAVLLAFSSSVVLSLFDSTSNDLLAAIPFVWSLAFAMEAVGEQPQPLLAAPWAIFWSGLFAGAAVACKLSNGPLVMLLPALWLLSSGSLQRRVWMMVLGSLATAAGFALAYGYWGWQLWTHVGNPIYPFCDACFVALRHWTGWQQP